MIILLIIINPRQAFKKAAWVCHEGKPQIQKQEVKATNEYELIGHGQRPQFLIICVGWIVKVMLLKTNENKPSVTFVCY